MIGANFAKQYGVNTPQLTPTMLPQGLPMPQMAAPQDAASFKLSLAEKLGLLGDTLTGRPMTAPLVNDRRQQAQAEIAEKRRAATSFDQWRMQQEWNRANPAPVRFEANNGDQIEIGPDGQPRTLYADPTPKVTMTPVKNADGTTTLYPTVNGQLVGASGASTTPRPAIGTTISDPRKGGMASPGANPFR